MNSVQIEIEENNKPGGKKKGLSLHKPKSGYEKEAAKRSFCHRKLNLEDLENFEKMEDLDNMETLDQQNLTLRHLDMFNSTNQQHK